MSILLQTGDNLTWCQANWGESPRESASGSVKSLEDVLCLGQMNGVRDKAGKVIREGSALLQFLFLVGMWQGHCRVGGKSNVP